MIRLKIVEKENESYKLERDNGEKYELILQFFDIEEELGINDYISISAELLNPVYKEYTTSFVFGGLDNICGKKDISMNDIDVIKIEKEDKEIYLKRLYG